jgi:hypothetical protein
VNELNDYKKLRHKHHPQAKSGAFFLSKKGRPVSYGAAIDAFHSLKKQLGWEQSPTPRPYDLRHHSELGISATCSPPKPYSTGIVPDKMSSGACLCCPLILATDM